MIDALLALDLPVVLSGVAAATCLTLAPVFKSREKILLAQLAAGLCFATHYATLGIAVAAAVNVLGTVQTVAALAAPKSKVMNRLGYAMIILMALVGLWFWQGPISALSVAAMTLIALARMQKNDLNLRLLLLAGGGFWLLHDIAGEAWIALLADIGAVSTGAFALFALFFKVRVEWRSLPAAA